MRRFFTAMLAVLFLFSCAEESEYGGAYAGSESTVIYTAESGVTVSLDFEGNRPYRVVVTTRGEANKDNCTDNNDESYWEEELWMQNPPSHAAVTLLYKITPPPNTIVANIKVKFYCVAMPHFPDTTIFYSKDGKETALATETSQDVSHTIEKEIPFSAEIADFFGIRLSFAAFSYSISVHDTLRLYSFTLYGADGSPIYFIGSDGSRYQLARYNDEYTPLVFTDSHGGTNNILLVNPLKSCASPIRLCCKNPDGSYPSERLRTYCERMGVSDGILAPATYTPPS